MPIISLGEFRPDVSDYEGQHSKNIVNAVPQGDGYGPFAGFNATTSALPGPCRGVFYALKNDGSVSIFAGTATKLYNLNNTTLTWTDVSLGAGTYTSLANTDNWEFAQFNNIVLAVQGNALPQSFDLTSSSAFANLGGSPPQAKYIAVVNRFVVLSGITSGSPPTVYRIQWSGLNAITTWDNVTNQSNFQDLADGGIVRGVAGGEFGTIFQDRSIRQMIYSPGSPYIFGIQRVSLDDGLFAPYSLVQAANNIFFLSPQGFKILQPGGLPTPIGKERIDRTFFADVDTANLQLMMGAADPRRTRVYWCYKSINNSSTTCDKVLVYDWALDKWSSGLFNGEFLVALSQPGTTLEGVDAIYNSGAFTNLTSISNGTPAVFTLNSHGLTNGQGIILATTGGLPAGLSTATPYYVTGASTNTFNVSATGGVGAFVGTNVATSSAGSGTHSFQKSNIDTLNLASLDSISTAAASQFGGVDSNNKFGFFNGPNLEAVLESSEHGGDGKRIFVRAIRPVTDAPGCAISVSARENEQTPAVYGAEGFVDIRGQVNFRVSTRYARAKIRIPVGTMWTFAAGIEPEIAPEGER